MAQLVKSCLIVALSALVVVTGLAFTGPEIRRIFGWNTQFQGPIRLATATSDVPMLSEPEVLELVLQRIPSPTNRQGVAEYARLEYLGRGEWLVQYGTSAAWKVREGDRQAEPLDEWARSLEEQERSDDQ